MKLVDRSNREREYRDTERFEVIVPQPKPVKTPRPVLAVEPCPPPGLPSIPAPPPGYIAPVMADMPPGPAIIPQMPPTVSMTYAKGYTIQIGAFRTQTSAVALTNKLLRYGFNAYISEALKNGQRLYRVRVGKYPNKAYAQRDAAQLRSRGFDTWITTLS